MTFINNIPLNKAIELYYEKHNAIRLGDLKKLRDLKQIYPDLFNPKTDNELRDIIAYVKWFAKTPSYEALKRQILKNRLTVIDESS